MRSQGRRAKSKRCDSWPRTRRATSAAARARIRLYEHRLAELKAGTRLVYPRLPARLNVGDVGTFPGPMTIVRMTGSDSYVMEADWSAPTHNLIGLPNKSEPSDGGVEIQFVYKLGFTSKNTFPAGDEFDMTNLMVRVVDVKGGLPVIEDASLPDELMLDLLAEYRRAKSGEAPNSGIRTLILLSN